MKQKSTRQEFRKPIFLFHSLDQISRSFWNAAYSELNTDYRFSANTLEMIGFIYMNPRCRQEDICRGLCIDKGCVAKGMLFLEQRELVRRDRSEADRRAYELTLAPAGNKVLRSLHKFAEKWADGADSSIDPEDLQAYYRVMNTMIQKAAEKD